MSKIRLNSITKSAVKSIGILAGIIAIVGGIVIALNWTYLRRLATIPENIITDTDWYKPLAKVSGKPVALKAIDSDTFSKASLNKISAYAKTHNSSALLVLHQGELVSEKYWRGSNASSTSNSMSMAKTVVALLIGIAIEEGHINSELEPVAKYIPEWSDDKRNQITLQDLLYMQSGLRNENSTSSLSSDLVQMYAGKDVNAIALEVPATDPPGKTFDYNNANTQILGEVLERATGETYIDYLSSRLWQPLQTNDADIWLDRPQGNPKTFCCLFATARDWGKVGQLLLNSGKVNNRQVVPSGWIDKMTQPNSIESNYGYQIWLEAKVKDKSGISRQSSQPFIANTIYLDGKSLQRVYVIPSQDLVIVRIGEQSQGWDDSVIVNTLVSDLSNQQTSIEK